MTPGDLQSQDESRRYLDRVREHELPGPLVELVDDYGTTVGDRGPFLWKWAHHLFPKFTLSSVPDQCVGRLQNDKLVGLMFVSVLDDVAEKHGDRATFEEAAKLPFGHLSPNPDRDGVDGEMLAFARRLWDTLDSSWGDGPRSSELEETARFDLKQVVNAIDYSLVANHDIQFVNGSDLRTHEAHNMMLFVFADLDLAYSPSFDRTELSTLRRVVEGAQHMARIGNWITTWERELYEDDFTSGIVVYALENGIVSPDELEGLKHTDDAAVEEVSELIRNHGVEDIFLRQWQDELDAAREYAGDVDSVDVDAYLDGIETVLDYHLASRGYK